MGKVFEHAVKYTSTSLNSQTERVIIPFNDRHTKFKNTVEPNRHQTS